MNDSILITGPARSGKSAWAERLAAESGRPVVYLATAREDPDDPDWSARIALHRQRRPVDWLTVCVPTELEAELASRADDDDCLLIDSLGTWVANLLDLDEDAWRTRVERFMDALGQGRAQVILVAEETGWGVIPAYPLGRLFRDRLGGLIRRLGPHCAATYLVAGGHALNLRKIGTPIDSPAVRQRNP